MNNYKEHFQKELEIMRKSIAKDDKLIVEDYIEPINAIIDIFSSQGHSGGSASYYGPAIAKTIQAVLAFKVLSPLTGEDSEWVDRSADWGLNTLQNIRDGGVWKDKETGVCTYSTGIVWKGEDAYDTFTGSVNGIASSVEIKEFPFLPKTFYVDLRRELYDPTNPEHAGKDVVSCGPGDMVYFIKYPEQIEEVFTFYNRRKEKLSNFTQKEKQDGEPTSNRKESVNEGESSIDKTDDKPVSKTVREESPSTVSSKENLED